MDTLRLGTYNEPALQASKWLSVGVLIDAEEMQNLFTAIGNFHLFLCGVVRPKNHVEITHHEFLERYKAYIESFKAGRMPEKESYQAWFSPAMTTSLKPIFAIPVNEQQQMIRVSKPVVQLQAHNISYSPVDKKFRSMVFGSDNIPWGIQFSYPQMYLDMDTKQAEFTKDTAVYPNTLLFQSIQKWVRQNTIPTPFVVEETLHNVPMRLGKRCQPWINRHPQLIKKGIIVKESS